MSEVRCRIDFAQLARDDLRDILDWYASQDVPQVGTRMVLEIEGLGLRHVVEHDLQLS